MGHQTPSLPQKRFEGSGIHTRAHMNGHIRGTSACLEDTPDGEKDTGVDSEVCRHQSPTNFSPVPTVGRQTATVRCDMAAESSPTCCPPTESTDGRLLVQPALTVFSVLTRTKDYVLCSHRNALAQFGETGLFLIRLRIGCTLQDVAYPLTYHSPQPQRFYKWLDVCTNCLSYLFHALAQKKDVMLTMPPAAFVENFSQTLRVIIGLQNFH